MRLNIRIALGALAVLSLTLPASAFPKPKFHMPFHKAVKQPETDVPETEKSTAAPPRRHTNGFPEADKKGGQYQPQSEKTWWGDSVWKTNRSEESWKQTQTK
jgi:hypothetical protein